MLRTMSSSMVPHTKPRGGVVSRSSAAFASCVAPGIVSGTAPSLRLYCVRVQFSTPRTVSETSHEAPVPVPRTGSETACTASVGIIDTPLAAAYIPLFEISA